ncbi:hypothetical protein Gogos_012022 [Gossypium gossypioides]|uniref:Uncharacterized protein n=1 Tax=Gossypium gossypioides TaxID=34282 RepID=A0A7J9BRJ7_GOSGO|nr:hypothetical protein [Gossypium gossypioides]
MPRANVRVPGATVLKYPMLYSKKKFERPSTKSLGERRRMPPSGGPEPSVRYHSRRARILALCQDLRANEQSQADNFYEA